MCLSVQVGHSPITIPHIARAFFSGFIFYDMIVYIIMCSTVRLVRLVLPTIPTGASLDSEIRKFPAEVPPYDTPNSVMHQPIRRKTEPNPCRIFFGLTAEYAARMYGHGAHWQPYKHDKLCNFSLLQTYRSHFMSLLSFVPVGY